MLKWSIAAVAIFIVGYLVYDYIGANDKQEDNPLFLPKFEFEGVLEDKISSQQIDGDEPVIVTYFNPTCAHCQALASEIYNHRDAMKKMDIFFIARAQKEQIADFAKDYRLNTIKNIHFGVDLNGDFYRFFRDQFVALVYVYNNQQMRVGIFQKDCTVKDIFNKLNITE